MRVLMTTDTVGGVWTFTQELATGLLDQGSDVALTAVGRRPNAAQASWSQAMRARWGSRFHFSSLAAPLEWMQDNHDAFTHAEDALLRTARDFRADVVHANQFCFGALNFDGPVVVTAHSDVLSWATACEPSVLQGSSWLSRYTQLVQAGLSNASMVVAPTAWMLSALAAEYPLPHVQRVIHNGRSLPPPPLCNTRKLQAVTAGRLWDPAKNIALLAEVSAPFPLLLAGEITCEASTAPPCPGGVRLLGPLATQALLDLFAESAIYICPSRYEPFGLAPLEAALCGCALVLNDLPSLREIWGDAALYFRDAPSLEAILTRLASTPNEVVRLQESAQSRASLYSREAVTTQYMAAFASAIACAEWTHAA